MEREEREKGHYIIPSIINRATANLWLKPEREGGEAGYL